MSRHIQPALVKFLDDKLERNGLAQEAMRQKDPRTLFRLALESCVGIREKTNHNDGPMVELIQSTLGSADHESWCMSLQQSGLAYVEEKLNVISPIFPTEHCLTCWIRTPISQRVKSVPLPGAICIWRHGDTDAGHTGCILEFGHGRMRLVEGNTESGIAGTRVERDGGGCYLTERDADGTGNMHVVGFLKPF